MGEEEVVEVVVNLACWTGLWLGWIYVELVVDQLVVIVLWLSTFLRGGENVREERRLGRSYILLLALVPVGDV